LSINTFSQTKDKPIFSGGLTFANYNIDTRKSPNFGVGVAFTLWNVYFDITSNWVNGAGEYLEYQSDSSYDTGKTNVVSGNLGYSFQLPKNFILTPYCGMVATTDIWEDPILNTTNFAVKRETKFNVGGLIQYEPIHPLNIYFGYANYEGVKFGVIIDFTPKSKN
jgi:hypothetical protein